MNLFPLFLVLTLFSGCFSLTCNILQPDDESKPGTPVDSWFILTTPKFQLGLKDAVGYQLATRSIGATDYTWTTVKGEQDLTIHRLRRTFQNHFAEQDKNGKTTLQFMVQNQIHKKRNRGQEPNTYNGYDSDEEKPHMPRIIAGPKTKPFYTKNNLAHDEKGYIALKNGDISFSAAHSKWIVSMDIRTKAGFILMHSIPEVPVQLGIPFPDEALNRFTMSQHIFCKSLTATEMTQLMTVIRHVFPPIVDFNFDIGLAKQNTEDRDVLGFINFVNKMTAKQSQTNLQQELLTAAQTCYQSYRADISTYAEACAKHESLTSGYFIMGHYPRPRLWESGTGVKGNRRKDTPPDQTSVTFDELGPYPWNAVATKANADLVLHHFNGYSIEENNQKKFLAQPRLVDIQKHSKVKHISVGRLKITAIPSISTKITPFGVNHLLSHHKIAYSVEPGNNLFCVGDANHVVDQIIHSGLVMCFPSKTLKEAFESWTVLDTAEVTLKEQDMYFEDVPMAPKFMKKGKLADTARINILKSVEKKLVGEPARDHNTADNNVNTIPEPESKTHPDSQGTHQSTPKNQNIIMDNEIPRGEDVLQSKEPKTPPQSTGQAHKSPTKSSGSSQAPASPTKSRQTSMGQYFRSLKRNAQSAELEDNQQGSTKKPKLTGIEE